LDKPIEDAEREQYFNLKAVEDETRVLRAVNS